ncbi:hypothetical protein FV139_17260 [Parahaliea maris]|uniref:Uncharacterized protein n=1 Tax=Parahaliea maris TaxID=2716870 RepID=A0A5C8ZSK3_9GAMM|nr:hypothetical protein [Parahaliea maris]TXS90729.1 hypothetical protein FV139_17260 [Parahaliea maris]
MKKLFGIFTLGALLASGSGQLLADDRRHGDHDRRGHHEYRDHHRDSKHYRKHHGKHHRKYYGHSYWKHDHHGRYYQRPGWRGDDRYFGLYFGIPGVDISLRHYHDGRACYDRHRH